MGSMEIPETGTWTLGEGGRRARCKQHSESLQIQVARCIQGCMGPSPTQSLLVRCSSEARVVGSTV